MITRVTLFGILAFFVLDGVVRAGGTPWLPPQKPAVVLPLLRGYSPKDTSEETVVKDMNKILGDDCLQTRHGPGGYIYELFYSLDDDTTIHVIFEDHNLSTISRERSARVIETFYPHSGR